LERGQEIELRIITDAIRRDHEETLNDMDQNNNFTLECIAQDIQTSTSIRIVNEQQSMLSLLSSRMSQREKAQDREQTVRKERIRREFQNEVDDERLRQEISHNNLVR